MNTAVLIGLITLIPVVFFIYDRFFRLKHDLSIEHGNIAFSRIISMNDNRNEKLAFIMLDLKIINSSNGPITLKDITLIYTDKTGQKESKPYSIPTGNIEGKESIALSNSNDNIIIAWENIWGKIQSNDVVPQGGIVRGSAVFILDTPADRSQEIQSISLIVSDYLGEETEHVGQLKEKWLGFLQKGFSLVDAPVKKTGDTIGWEGVTITTEKPA